VTPEATEWLRFWSAIAGSVLVLAGVIYTARKARQSTEQSSQVGFIQQLLSRVSSLESQVTDLWKAREEDARVKRAQGDHIDVLEDHIWQRLPPPPPPRPPGV
jgi:hypothetical protein